jgi:hypothetical protein
MELTMYVNGEKKEPLQLKFISDNAHSILNAIQEELFALKQNMVLEKVVVTPKQEFFDFFKSKPEPLDLVKLSTKVTPDALKKLSVEPTIDVYVKRPTGGRRRSRKSRRKTRKNKRV